MSLGWQELSMVLGLCRLLVVGGGVSIRTTSELHREILRMDFVHVHNGSLRKKFATELNFEP